MTPEQLAAAAGCRIERASKWLPHLELAMERYEINTPTRQAAFISQVAHESARLSVLEENLNYSSEQLNKLFPKYFSLQAAMVLARRPRDIANRIYGDRMGNGPDTSDDGWKYRGRGLIQITGRDNYVACGHALDLDLIHEPDLLLAPEYAALSAGWYWQKAGCNEVCDRGDFDGVCDVINRGRKTAAVGDAIGYGDRLALFKGASAALAA